MTYATSPGAPDSTPMGRHFQRLRKQFGLSDDDKLLETIGPDGVQLYAGDGKHAPSVVLDLKGAGAVAPPRRKRSATQLDIDAIRAQTLSKEDLLFELLGVKAIYGQNRRDLALTLTVEQVDFRQVAAGTLGRVTLAMIGEDGTVGLQGSALEDVLLAGNGATITTGYGDDDLVAGEHSSLYGGGGDDTVMAGDGSTLSGGDGDDYIRAGNYSKVSGGYGRDDIAAGSHVVIDGGASDDTIAAGDDARIDGNDGDDIVRAGNHAVITGGWGDDDLVAGSNARIDGGRGNDTIAAGEGAVITDVFGDNRIQAGAQARVVTGDGDDTITVGAGSEVRAGEGKDRIQPGDGSIVYFEKGDGNDTLRLDRATQRGAIVAFGAGISAADLGFSMVGGNLVVKVGRADSLTIEDPAKNGLPGLLFADGTTMQPAELARMVLATPPSPPASRRGPG